MKILSGPNFRIDEPTVVTIGKFDGLHEGHIKVLNKVLDISKRKGLKSAVYTFDKNPKLVINQDTFRPLMTNEEKNSKIESFGIDFLVYENFTNEFAKILPEEFCENILKNKLSAKVVVMGENSTFGKDRVGDTNVMKLLGEKYGFDVEIVELVKKNGEVISSTNIREKIDK